MERLNPKGKHDSCLLPVKACNSHQDSSVHNPLNDVRVCVRPYGALVVMWIIATVWAWHILLATSQHACNSKSECFRHMSMTWRAIIDCP